MEKCLIFVGIMGRVNVLKLCIPHPNCSLLIINTIPVKISFFFLFAKPDNVFLKFTWRCKPNTLLEKKKK